MIKILLTILSIFFIACEKQEKVSELPIKLTINQNQDLTKIECDPESIFNKLSSLTIAKGEQIILEFSMSTDFLDGNLTETHEYILKKDGEIYILFKGNPSSIIFDKNDDLKSMVVKLYQNEKKRFGEAADTFKNKGKL